MLRLCATAGFPPSLPPHPASTLAPAPSYFLCFRPVILSAHLHTQLFPLAVELLQLLLQQRWVPGCHVLGQVHLHSDQFLQSTGQKLQGELCVLHNTFTQYKHKDGHTSMYKQWHTHFSTTLGPLWSAVQIKELWMGRGEGNKGRKGEGSESTGYLIRETGVKWGATLGWG